MRRHAARLRLEYQPLASLRRLAGNPKRHHASIAPSIARWGFNDPFVIDEASGQLVEGHGRLDALEARRKAGEPPPERILLGPRGSWLVPVVRGVSFATETEARAYAVAHNQLTIAGGWEDAALAEALREARDAAIPLDLLGWEAEAVAGILGAGDGGGGEDPGPQADRAAELQAKWGTALGQLWEIPSRATPGRVHRLLCGDSTRAEDVARLALTQAMAILDPPFEAPETEWTRHISDPCIVFGQAKHIRAVPDALWRFERVIDKVMSHRSATVQVGHRHAFVAQCGSIKTLPTDPSLTFPSIVISEERPNHPHEKAVDLLVEHLVHFTPASVRSLFDPYHGSGTTTVAAEQTGRLCYAIEIDPRYVAVALERLAGMGLEPRRCEP